MNTENVPSISCHRAEYPRTPIHIHVSSVAWTARWQVTQRLWRDVNPELVTFWSLFLFHFNDLLLYPFFLSFCISPWQLVFLLFISGLKLSLEGEKKLFCKYILQSFSLSLRPTLPLNVYFSFLCMMRERIIGS
jgi:hypothetical protein